MNALDNFYLNQSEPNRSVFMALREIILSLDKEMTPEWKYKLPFFYYKKRPFCYLWQDKKTNTPYIGIVRSTNLNHPKLELGTRKKMKIYSINPNKDIDIDELLGILRMVMVFY